MPWNECIVMGPMAAVLRISRVFGMAPIKLIPLHRVHSRLAPLDGYHILASQGLRIYSYIITIVYMIVTCMKIVYFESQSYLTEALNVQSLFWKLIYFFQLLCYTTIIFLSIFRSHSRMEHLVCYLSTLEKLNWKMNNSYANIKIKYSKAILWGFLLVVYIIGAIYIYKSIPTLSEFYKAPYVLSYVMYFGTYALMLLSQLQFAFLVFLVNETLSVLHERLQSLIVKSEIFSVLDERNGLPARIAIQNLHQIYESIRKLVTQIDENEGFLIILIFIYKVLSLTYSIHNLKDYSDNINNMLDLGPLILEIVWISYVCSTLILLVEPCHQTWKKFQMIRVLVSRLICISTRKDTKEVLYSFSFNLVLNVPTFSPLGICTFTRQLLLTMAGVFVSYLIILF